MPFMLKCGPHFLPSSPILASPNHLSRHHFLQNSVSTTHNIKKLKTIHTQTRPTLYFFNFYLQIYVNAGLMQEARELFDTMPERTLISWTILMTGYTRHGPAIETLMIFRKMVQDYKNASLRPDSFVFAIVLRACAAVESLNCGRELHCLILKFNGAIDLFIENALITMYASCGSLLDSARVFARVEQPDLVSWSSMLRGYMQNGLEEEGLELFCQMLRAGVLPDAFAFSMVIGGCASLSCLDFGVQTHCYLIKMGCDFCLFLENSLMDFYARCEDMSSSRQIFDKMTERNVVSWNTIITGYVHNLHSLEALQVFRAFMDENSKCDEFTLASMLQAVTGLGTLHHGIEIHGYIIKAGFQSNLYVINSLLDMYVECIDHNSSDQMDEVPPKIFNRLEGVQSDEFIIASILKWSSLQLDLETGKMFHSQIIKLNLNSDSYVISSLIDMYAKCGLMNAARRVFMRVMDFDIVPWSVFIAGHCWNGWFREALKLFRKMQFDCVKANEYTYTSVLLACLALGDLRKGRELHSKILRTGYGSNTSVINTLINLYSELWDHQQALKLCSLIPDAEISWGFLIQACLRVKDHETIHELLHRIQRSHGNLDSISACYILISCANPLFLNVGTQAQAYMSKRGLLCDSITRNSLIDMYSECGTITDAVTAFNNMPEKNSVSWTLIISANVDHGKPSEALEFFSQMRLKNMSPNSGTFISVLKAYAQTGQVDEAFRLFISMNEIYGIKPSAEHYSSMIEVLGQAGLFEDAQEFIDVVLPFKPGPLIWRALLSSCRIHGNMKVAKYAAEKLLELEPCDFAANLVLVQVLLTIGKWVHASKLKIKNKCIRASSSWIEIRNNIYEFVSDQIPTKEVCAKLMEMEDKMKELGYVADRNHLLHDAEEEEYEGVGLRHTEIKALAFGLISLPNGKAIRVVKSVRMCGDCHSAFKFLSTFVGRELVVKDSCTFHNFRAGKCSCRDAW